MKIKMLFLDYFLKHVKEGANIKLHTILNNKNTISNLISTFTNPPFDRWNISLYLFRRRRDQHAREIITNKYYIEIEKGMAVFGRYGNTDQTNITIGYKDEMYDPNINPISQLIYA
ncbi:hypothetical protein BTS2_2958 [Bacillus sp. TS-2]|nr:hypothetical protein BTS2_2958 [Bacillus sp. TS-2]